MTLHRSKVVTSTTAAAAIASSLLFTGISGAQANLPAEPSEAVSESVSSTAETNEQLAANAPVTMPQSIGEATGDVLGLGYDQRVAVQELGRSAVIFIYDAPIFGGELLARRATNLPAGWPANFDDQFHGASNARKADLNPHSVAVLNGKIYVSATRTVDEKANGSSVYRYSADGTLEAQFDFTGEGRDYDGRKIDGNKTAITSLDAIAYEAKNYIAVGLNQNGVRIIDADAMKPVTALYENWEGRGRWHGDTVTAVKLGVDDAGRLLAAIGKFTYNDYALYVADPFANTTVGVDNWRGLGAWQWPSALAFGKFGDTNETMIGVGWPTPDRVSVLRFGATNLEQIPGAPINGPLNQLVQSLRFYTDSEGRNRLIAERATVNGDGTRSTAVFGVRNKTFVELPAGFQG